MDKERDEHLRHVFDSFCKRVLRNAANDYYDSLESRRKHEVLLEDYWRIPHTVDHYVTDSTVYHVMGEDIQFTDSSIIAALNSMSEENRIIVLAACVIGLPDRVIAEQLHLVRRTLTYRKAKLLSELRRLLSSE